MPGRARSITQTATANPLVQRERLYQLLDASGGYGAVWLCAAGGYGKTTLARAWAAARETVLLTVSLPESGTTCGEMFYCLREAAQERLHPDASALPLLNPEYSGAPELFAHTFARRLADLAPTVLLIDDVHHTGANQTTHRVFAALAEELAGTRVRLLIASRAEPPPDWARLRGQNGLLVVDERQLAFDLEETAALLRAHGLVGISPETPEHWHSLTRGWPAGLMLLLDQWRRTGRVDPERLQARSLDDWFLSEIWSQLGEDERELLCQCALPSRVPVEAVAQASGQENAEARLAVLWDEHAFLWLDEDRTHYRLHDLFRAFLRGRARERWGEPGLRERKRIWGSVLWRHGEWSAGAAMLIEAGDHEGLAAGIREAAPELLQTGRGKNLHDWLLALPEAWRRADPELCLWEGMCLLLQDTRNARALLQRAWEALAARQATVPMAIAWSGIVDSIWLEWAHVSEYERWIDEFYRFEDTFRRDLPAPLWYAVLRGILAATSYGRPLDPNLERWAREAETSLGEGMPDTERVMLAGQLMFLNTWQFGRRDGAARVMALMARRPEAIERASPLARCLWHTFTALHALLFDADIDGCQREAEIGRELIREYGICTWDDAVPPLQAALCMGNRELMDDWLRWFLRPEPKASRPFYDTFQAHFLAGQAWLRGDINEAVAHCEQAVVAAEHHGSIVISAGFRAVLAACLAEAGQRRAALHQAARARHTRQGFASDFLDLLMYLPLARIPLLAGQPQRALPALRRAFEAGAQQRMFFPFMVRREELAEMCGLALREGIEPEYALWLAEQGRLPPPRDARSRESWPWPCRIRVLGCFAIEVEGKPVQLGARPSRRLQAVLSELVLAGPAGVAQDVLAERLWPDSTPERATNALHVTLHRLRDVLGDAGYIQNCSNRIVLAPDRVWVDLWAFEALASSAERLDRVHLQRALRLYAGPAQLSGTEELELDLRQEALVRKHERVALLLGSLLEAEDLAAARDHYRHALALNPVQDDLWAGLLRCEAALGGATALQRCWYEARRCYTKALAMDPPADLQDLVTALSKV